MDQQELEKQQEVDKNQQKIQMDQLEASIPTSSNSAETKNSPAANTKVASQTKDLKPDIEVKAEQEQNENGNTSDHEKFKDLNVEPEKEDRTVLTASDSELFHDVPRVETSDSEIFNDCIEKGMEISEDAVEVENLDIADDKTVEFSDDIKECTGEDSSSTEISSEESKAGESCKLENNDVNVEKVDENAEKTEEKVKPKRPPPPNTRLLQY